MEDPNDIVAVKRARNTLAARKSREKKITELKEMEEEIRKLTVDRDHWMQVAITHGATQSVESDRPLAGSRQILQTTPCVSKKNVVRKNDQRDAACQRTGGDTDGDADGQSSFQDKRLPAGPSLVCSGGP